MRHIVIVILLLLISLPLAAQNAATLPPGQLLLPESALPDYESKIDHVALIKRGNFTDRWHPDIGRRVYYETCFNCHGDKDVQGSLPDALRFGEGKFQHGSDHHTMYQTITRGWRLMPPEVHLMPIEKHAVIAYIQNKFLKNDNKKEYFKVTDDYLAKLPIGEKDNMGPAPVLSRKWRDMDYGSFLMGTFEIAGKEKRSRPLPSSRKDKVDTDANIAHKAIGIRLDKGQGGVSKGSTWLAFEHDTMRIAGAWTGGEFIDWRGINFDGGHVVRPRTSGEPLFETYNVPGWCNPKTGKFKDERFIGIPEEKFPDGRRFGPLSREWMHYKGLYKHGDRNVIAYTVGDANILESHDLTKSSGIVRILNISKSTTDMIIRLANAPTRANVVGNSNVKITESEGYVIATIPSDQTPVNLAFVIGGDQSNAVEVLDLTRFTKGGPPQWPNAIVTTVAHGKEVGAFQQDIFNLPLENPWKSRMRTAGFDFTPDGKSAIIACWDGDVWRVDGITETNVKTVTWKRIASGLFQPLGVKLRNGEIFVTCRDQLVRLNDLNGDGETDFYEAFNSDHQVTEHFHEFAMGLQTDKDGNFYYAKSARHARTQLVAHHGTLLKVSADGEKTDIIANGFRAANGICINPDGSFFVTDQEGHWTPQNRINWIKPGGGFYGNMWSYGAPEDSADSAMEQPLCWVTKGFDRSPSELVWVDSEKWGALNGKLLNISYGLGRLEIVPHEFINGQPQGGLCRMEMPEFQTGTMRGRFHQGDLYICGLAAWSTSKMQMPGGFYRMRHTGKPTHLPVGLNVTKRGVKITLSDPVTQASVASGKYSVKSWALKRTKNYGSKHYNTKKHKVSNSRLSNDGLVLTLDIENMAPVWQMEIRYQVTGKDGAKVKRTIHNTIHHLGLDAEGELSKKIDSIDQIKPTVVFITGDDEYKSREIMLPFAKQLEQDYGFKIIYLKDEAIGAHRREAATVLEGAERIKEADLMVLFVRFRKWESKSYNLFMDHFNAGKPVLGIRTTTHAFWEDKEWAPKYLGGHYKTHPHKEIVCQVNPEHKTHPMVRGVSRKFAETEGPYVSTPLTEGAVPIMLSYGWKRWGKPLLWPGRKKHDGNDSFESPTAPVVWTFNQDVARRGMITLLSSRSNSHLKPYSRKLFFNSVFWALGLEVPKNGVLSAGADLVVEKEKTPYRQPKVDYPAPPIYKTPKGWVSLFDGKNLDQWKHYDYISVEPKLQKVDARAATIAPFDPIQSPARWLVENDTTTARIGYGDIMTKKSYKNFKLHLDFLVPNEPDWVKNEWKGNSGIFLRGAYEICIFNSFGDSPGDRTNGAIYRQAAPLKEASLPAGQWQTYDITVIDKTVTIILNGKIIHEYVQLKEPTPYGFPVTRDGGPIRLQSECSAVQFANIAIKEI